MKNSEQTPPSASVSRLVRRPWRCLIGHRWKQVDEDDLPEEIRRPPSMPHGTFYYETCERCDGWRESINHMAYGFWPGRVQYLSANID